MFEKVPTLFGIEYPIFAFSHCRDVVVAVSKAGGMGVFGAAHLSDEQLDRELTLIDEALDGAPYAVDVLIPSPNSSSAQVASSTPPGAVPPEHWQFVENVLEDLKAPPLHDKSDLPSVARSAQVGSQHAEVALHHRAAFIVSALGTPPAHVIDSAHAHGIKVGALAGRVKHAQRHAAAGVDVIIAQGAEAGGHTGEVTTMVLVPDVVDAVAPVPVLAAGGIGTGRQIAAAEALGADGVWTGSIWLAADESDAETYHRVAYENASSEDTVRSKIRTGKPVRMLRSRWTDAWLSDEAPEPLTMGLQHELVVEAHARLDRLADPAATPSLPVGQIVGRMAGTKSSHEILYAMIAEYVEILERMHA